MNDPRASAERFAGSLRILAAALNGDYRPRLPNGDLPSRRGGFGASAKRFKHVQPRLKLLKTSKAVKAKSRQQARNNRARRKAVRS